MKFKYLQYLLPSELAFDFHGEAIEVLLEITILCLLADNPRDRLLD